MPNGARNWCFTLNNYSPNDVQVFVSIGEEGIGIKYFVFGEEVGEGGTPHLQCFVSFDQRRSLAYCRNLFSERAHYEIARGSPAQNRTYCTKDNRFKEFGELPVGRGGRTDLNDCLSDIRKGSSRRFLAEKHVSVFARYPRFIAEALLIYGKRRDWKPEVFVYWGETGTGKTRKAFEEAGSSAFFHPGGPWFDGYDCEDHVIFDDFGGSEFKLTYFLKLLDRYPMRVPIKGGFMAWVPKKIWITSNYSPKEWYANAKDEHVKALFRRFDRVVRYRRMASVNGPGNDDEDEVVVE